MPSEGENSYRSRVIPNRLHGWLLELSCLFVGRDFNTIVRFNSYREEQHTIHCFYAIFIVVSLAVLTMNSGIGYLFFDLQKYLRSPTADYILEGLGDKKLVVSVFWGFIIYYIDMTILNGQTKKIEHHDSNDVGFFKALLSFIDKSSIGFLFANKLLLFRVVLIISVATISSVFLMANFTSQLLAYKERQSAVVGIGNDKVSSAEGKQGLRASNGQYQTQKRQFNEELLKLNSEKRVAGTEYRKSLNEINIEEKRLIESYQEKVRECGECAPEKLQEYHHKISSIRERARINRAEARATFEIAAKEVSDKIADANSKIQSLDKDMADNNAALGKIDSELSRAIEDRKKIADANINESRSLAALMLYPFSLPWEEKMLSLMVFLIIFSIIAVADISVLVVKYSYRSLYDLQMNRIDDDVSGDILKGSESEFGVVSDTTSGTNSGGPRRTEK